LVINPGVPHGLEIAFYMLHRISSSRLLRKYLMGRLSLTNADHTLARG
jgi:hypothetical protein